MIEFHVHDDQRRPLSIEDKTPSSFCRHERIPLDLFFSLLRRVERRSTNVQQQSTQRDLLTSKARHRTLKGKMRIHLEHHLPLFFPFILFYLLGNLGSSLSSPSPPFRLLSISPIVSRLAFLSTSDLPFNRIGTTTTESL
jgi:hypothetical protein